MSRIVSIDPFRCRMWESHDRFQEHLTEASCHTEIDSFRRHGQLVPAVGRPVTNDPDFEIELICGARRLFVARHLRQPLLVEVRELSDREAIVLMDIENRHRTDVCPYERGLGYARWLRSGLFSSQDDIARALKISPSQVSRLMKLARLPSVIVGAFDSPTDIHEVWGLDLVEAIEDPEKRRLVVRKARAISSGSTRLSAREVYQVLLGACASGPKVKQRRHDEVVKDASGNPLFRVRQQTGSIALLLPPGKVSARMLQDLRSVVANILQAEKRKVVEFARPIKARKSLEMDQALQQSGL